MAQALVGVVLHSLSQPTVDIRKHDIHSRWPYDPFLSVWMTQSTWWKFPVLDYMKTPRMKSQAEDRDNGKEANQTLKKRIRFFPTDTQCINCTRGRRRHYPTTRLALSTPALDRVLVISTSEPGQTLESFLAVMIWLYIVVSVESQDHQWFGCDT